MSQSLPPTLRIWIRLVYSNGQPFNNHAPSMVSTSTHSDVYDLRHTIKSEFPNALSPIDAAFLVVYKNLPSFNSNELPLEADTPICGLGMSKMDALIVVVPGNSVTKPSRLVSTRKMAVEASCRKYLDSLAFRLSTYYAFSHKFRSGATFGDVLEAVKQNNWSYYLEPVTREQVTNDGDIIQVNAGDPKLPIPLPSLFTDDEWKKLRSLNLSTNARIHDRELPRTSKGKYYVIIPHSELNDEMVSILRNVGVKATLINRPEDLEVKDEDLLSDSSFIDL